MDLIQAIRTRKTFRAFTDVPVSRVLIREILLDGHHAPSASNMQPWEFHVLTGKPLTDLCAAIEAHHRTDKIKYDSSRDKKIPDKYMQRRKDLFRALKPFMNSLGDRHRSFIESGSIRFYDAPCVIFMVTDRDLHANKLMDIGMAAENIMLSAHARGLSTCAIAYTLLYLEPIRKALQLVDHQEVALSISLGYPDQEFAVNRFRSDRVDLDEVIVWKGF